ncbi:hypothetical protein FC15_GL000879 [Lapidilactobacillus concavus DSM 17758]|uniref:AP2/ERF domain-containing protein n=1 Tax=Lapidilactobacillus concavus DSM 17758 TaxID=1423735 RepID=A0A0R1WFP8_9LACO|nr:AP2 domain-containing protein [Lapidilactobacillus concavus]KRM13715.1 hypothetical protein FC15_GL000879 [Lapidilactobacillus concavus DSM 17758]GEL12593.1 hypothetical protein LCO01nite_01420 [Lapidilactobacillus concavus]
MKSKDLTGQQFGHLTVIGRVANRNGRPMWLCQCDCGKQKEIAGKHLLNGHTISCGHIKRDRNNSIAPGYEANKVDGIAVFLLDDKRKIRTDNTTGVTGVKRVRYRNGSIHYAAAITIAGKRYHIGTYDTIEQAAKARKEAADKLIPKK